MLYRSHFGAFLLTMLVWTANGSPAPSDATSPDAGFLKDFNKNIADYLKLHRLAESEVHRLKPTSSPEAIERYEHHLSRRIRELRRDAVQGNIFTPEIAAGFRRLIGITMQGPEAPAIRQSLQRATPAHPRAIRVNSPYPSNLPLPSTPPSLLLNLPPLPADLEYRVLGHDLVLRDIDANLVVDSIPKIIP